MSTLIAEVVAAVVKALLETPARDRAAKARRIMEVTLGRAGVDAAVDRLAKGPK